MFSQSVRSAIVVVLAAHAIAAGQFQIQWVPDSGTFPNAPQVNAALFRVKAKFDRLLENDVGYARINVTFSALGAAAAPASTSGTDEDIAYATARTKLYDLSVADDEPLLEQQVYEYLLQENEIPVIFANNTPVGVSELRVARCLLLSKWVPGTAQDSGTITFNSSKVWDWYSKNGVDPNSLSFEHVLTHEVMHVLGFSSELDSTADDKISVLDLFRVKSAGFSSGITNTAFRDADRMLQPGIEALTVTRFSSANHVYGMSTGTAAIGGDGYQASHWKHHSTPPGYIGVMNPTITAGENRSQDGGYLRVPDIRALDTLGWNIDSVTPPAVPAAPLPQQPGNGQQRSGFRPTFEWSPQGGASAHDVFVFEGSAPSEATTVYAVEDLTGTSHTMPYGVLDESTLYSWMVVATNDMGFTYSALWTFTTRCYADCDADGMLTSADFGCFQTKYATGDPEADCNEDGALNQADFGCFQTKYAVGCP